MYRWHDGSNRMRVYEAIKASGHKGLTARDITRMYPGQAETNLHVFLKQFARGGWVERSGKGVRLQPYVYRVTAACQHPNVLPHRTRKVFEVVADCPAGIDEKLLAAEVSMYPKVVRRLMLQPIELGMAEAFERAPGHMAYRPLPVVPEDALRAEEALP